MPYFTRHIAEAVSTQRNELERRSGQGREFVATVSADLLLGDEVLLPYLATAELARHVDMAESSLFRIIGRPLIPKAIQLGVEHIRVNHLQPRDTALRERAADLVRDEVEPLEGVEKWSVDYTAYANPAAVLEVARVLRTPKAAEYGEATAEQLINGQTALVGQCVGLLVARTNVVMPDDYASHVFTQLAALDSVADIVDYPAAAEAVLVAPLS